MQKYGNVLAVFNNNNFCLVIVTKETVEYLPYYPSDNKHRQYTFPIFSINPPIVTPNYNHIGFIKTYQKCKAIYTWPWYLLGDLTTGKIYDFNETIQGKPLENPPLSLYKSLIDTEYDAVYFDTMQNKPVFIEY